MPLSPVMYQSCIAFHTENGDVITVHARTAYEYAMVALNIAGSFIKSMLEPSDFPNPAHATLKPPPTPPRLRSLGMWQVMPSLVLFSEHCWDGVSVGSKSFVLVQHSHLPVGYSQRSWFDRARLMSVLLR